ncbi:lytic transglycosylase domain-containing protein [Brevundimonas sp.]|uniref:lytic transglycosylase domain-containing protein n=1 Tax=Brevundimonas sp. TaxID=1871086 RepID=UPI003B00250D
MLDFNLVLSLSLACAPGVAPETLAAVAWTESRFDPLAIGVNSGPRPPRRASDAAEAARIARDLLARGANLDLGIGQINSSNLDWLDLSVEQAFDPCRNLSAAGRVLRAGYRPRPGEPPQTALRRALSRYNTGDPRRGFANGYVGRVENAAARLGLAAPAAAVAPAPSPLSPASEPSPQPSPAPWDVFGRARYSAVLAFAIAAPEWSPIP